MKKLDTKKRTIIALTLIMILIIGISLVLINNNTNKNDLVLNNPNKKQITNSFLTLMLEQSDGSYQESTTNTWPSGNYAFNSELSRCENGGELRWDRENGIVELLSNKSDACYVYFDLYNVVQISNVESTKTYNSITVTVTTSGGENPVDKYYFSIDGGNSYQESTSSSYTFSNLTDNHEYTIQVYAKDTLGYESNEEIVEVTTNAYVNPTVNSVTATSVTNDSITVSVNASAGTNNIQNYYYSINNGGYTSSSSNTYTFSGLSAGTSYSIRVYITDTNGIDSNVYTINTETDDIVLLADYIKSLYTSQGSNGIYYHTSSLANSAGDNSYRYAGANPNNYVCFGSDASTCPSDNLYRIIGVFGDEVKLIKSTSYGSYNWSSGGSNIWNSSDLRNILNSTFLNNFNNTWQNKISTHVWNVGGTPWLESYNWPAQTVYDYELGNSSINTTDTAKIGLMYISDYGFSTVSDYWQYIFAEYDEYLVRNNNWMWLGSSESTITRISDLDSSQLIFIIDYGGSLSYFGNPDSNYAIRPCFYLVSSTQYISGSGTSSDPIRIN